MNLTISPRAVRRWLAGMVILIACASAMGQIIRYQLLNGRVTWYIALLDLNREQNLPSYYQGITIFISAMLLTVIARHKVLQRDSQRVAWSMLACIFYFLSVDEMCSLHEQLAVLMEKTGIKFSGLLTYSWVVPAMLIVLVVGFMFLRFVFHFRNPIRTWIIISGAIYVGGAIGVEMISGWYEDAFGSGNLAWELISNVEECMEMTGIAIFIVTLLNYMSEHLASISIGIAGHEPQPPAIVRSTPQAVVSPGRAA
ncbi:MAG TPA: hypothetical protein VHD56_12535 [Tepidisphaeraceae bacterium]|nr:hypothetical protein [Tepidisphaeraceae bacterium]